MSKITEDYESIKNRILDTSKVILNKSSSFIKIYNNESISQYEDAEYIKKMLKDKLVKGYIPNDK